MVFHGQQTVQFANASAIANLTSDAQAASPPPGPVLTREEELIISGNVPPGDYEFALHSYDERMVPDSMAQADVGFGNGWSSNLLRELEVSEDRELISVVHPDGKKDPWQKTPEGWQGEADSLLNLTEDQSGFLVTYKNGSKERYGHHYKLLSITDAVGRVMRYSYDDDQKLTKVTEPFGLSFKVSYGPDNHVTMVSTPNGEDYRYAYDEIGNLISVTYPDDSADRRTVCGN